MKLLLSRLVWWIVEHRYMPTVIRRWLNNHGANRLTHLAWSKAKLIKCPWPPAGPLVVQIGPHTLEPGQRVEHHGQIYERRET